MDVQDDYNHTTEKVYLLRVFAQAASVISIVSVLFVLMTNLLFPRLRTMASEFVVMLVLSNLLWNSASLIMTDDQISSWCSSTAVTFFFIFAGAASYVWSFCIAFTIHKIVVQSDWSLKTSDEFLKRYRCRAHLICWSAALVPGFLLPTIDISEISHENQKWVDAHYLVFLSILSVLLFYVIFVYYQTWNLVRKLKLAKGGSFESEATYSSFYNRSSYITKARLKLYPMVYLLKVAALWAEKGFEFSTHRRAPFLLFALNTIITNLQGFMNSMVFGCTEIVLYEWTRCLRRKTSIIAREPIGFEYTVVADKAGESSAVKDDIYFSPANLIE